jgi:hypothetical protein
MTMDIWASSKIQTGPSSLLPQIAISGLHPSPLHLIRTDEMSGRVGRERKPVNYNQKELERNDGVPAWLKDMKFVAKEDSGGEERSRSKSKGSVIEKENAPQQEKSGVEDVKLKAKQPTKQKKADKAGMAPRAEMDKEVAGVAARGRNAGVTVVPIGE